jgi:hypothetical protein
VSQAAAELATRASAWLVGERSAELVGAAALAALPRSLRLVVLDTHPLDVPAAQVEIGVPDAVERTGTWVNVDGVRGEIRIARSAPAGVPPLTRTLDELERLLAVAPAPEVAR